MNTNKAIGICGIVCLLCGIIISAIVFIEGEDSIYRKIIGPLNVVVGLIFIIVARHKKSV